ncbi:hypothetical protein QR680_019026 [Steinernema hermaphroditum]|uniref:Uncharacterized protein n=1 Tax=Steinernema hermaphroditum TaxID=289476 RepID=A0AA39HJQ4_9BILA|nr:hypothetical protein QR680_019026 [Steinernema hermaphroditum]
MSDSLDSHERDLLDSATTGDSSAPTDRTFVNLLPSGTESDGDYEEDAITAAEVLKQMNEIWLHENASPTLLPHRDEIVHLLVGCIRDMEANFANNFEKLFKEEMLNAAVEYQEEFVAEMAQVNMNMMNIFGTVLQQLDEKLEEIRAARRLRK